MKDPVVQEGAAVLRQVAKPVAKKDFGSPTLKKLFAHMKEVLAKEEFGVALAAPQVGEPLRLFVVAGRAFLSDDEKAETDNEVDESRPVPPDMVFINPEIIRTSRKKHEMSEGCLSVRGKYGTVLRHEKVSLRAHDIDGKQFTYHASGLVAHIFQHEMDHLDGILYIDKAIKLEEDEDLQTARGKLKEKHGI